MSARQQRQMRIYKNKSRGDSRSYKTELENVQMLLAWESGDLSEGQLSRALGIDRVTLRMMRDGALASGVKIAGDLLAKGEG